MLRGGAGISDHMHRQPESYQGWDFSHGRASDVRLGVIASLLTSVKLTRQNHRFPLFSKGVDTYRFEYGVFLLNKNLEMVNISVDSDQWPCVYVCFDSSWRTTTSVRWTCGIRFPI